MDKLILKTVTIVFFLLSSIVSAQDFQGQAFYQTKRKIDLKIDNSQMTDEQQSQMQEMLKKQFERTYILTFNKEASVYKEEAELDKPTAPASSGGVRIMTMGGGADQKYYKNTKTKTYADEQDVFGKAFLVKDALETFDWVLGDESKVIGKYLCFNATATREVEGLSMSFSSDDKEDDSSGVVKEKELQTITAWYTMDIPVSNGPDEFWGLPGLILELQDGDDMQYVCTKIVMNTKDEISEPTKGKVVNQEEYDEVLEKKMKEMQQQYGGRDRKGGSEGFQIRVGG